MHVIDKRCKTCYNVIMPDQPSSPDTPADAELNPGHIGHVLGRERLDVVIGFQGDPDRETMQARADLLSEMEGLLADIAELKEMVEGGADVAQARAELERRVKELLSAQSEHISLDGTTGTPEPPAQPDE
jgi:hypothetical protein